MILAQLASPASSGLDVWSLVMDSGPMAKLVLLTLALFSVVSWGITVERFLRFRRAEEQSRTFLERFNKGGGLASIQEDTASLSLSPHADIFRAAFREISLNPPPDGQTWQGAQLDALDRIVRRNASSQLSELERSLGFLATTASATPFIGLFGTVWGIMNAFRGIGVSGTASLAAYAPGIAEALVATAFGLFVAIPAVWAFNYLIARVEGFTVEMDNSASELIDYMAKKSVSN